jgi:hypothetical protein
VALDRITGWREAPGMDNLPQCLPSESLVNRIFHGEPRLYWGELIRCQSGHGNYVCSLGRVVISDGDRMSFSTRVSVARHAWVSEVTSYHVWH